MSTNKSPLYLHWLLIICVSDDRVVKSQVYKFQFHIVVTSQSINKKFGAPTPSSFVYKHVNAQPYENYFEVLQDNVCGVIPRFL